MKPGLACMSYIEIVVDPAPCRLGARPHLQPNLLRYPENCPAAIFGIAHEAAVQQDRTDFLDTVQAIIERDDWTREVLL